MLIRARMRVISIISAAGERPELGYDPNQAGRAATGPRDQPPRCASGRPEGSAGNTHRSGPPHHRVRGPERRPTPKSLLCPSPLPQCNTALLVKLPVGEVQKLIERGAVAGE